MKSISAGAVTFMMVAILFGLVSAYAVRSYLAKPEPKTVDVWVASVNLPKHARINPENVRAVPTPIHQVPADAIVEQGKVTARLVSATIEAGQPVTETKLFPIDGEPSLSDQIPPGKRAVTISVTERTALAGVLLPDSLIDISLTAEPEHPDVERAMTVTLVRSVKVLATSQQRHRFSENSVRPLRTITVAASPRQANKLILAQQYGRLHVTLCSSLDESVENAADTVSDRHVQKTDVKVDTEPNVDVAQTIQTVSESRADRDDAITPHELLGLAPPRVERPVVAQIWRGTSMTEVQFQQHQIDESVRATVAARNRRAVGAKTVSSHEIRPLEKSRFDADH